MSLSLLTYCVKASPSFYLEMCAYQYFRLLQGVPAVTPGSGTWDLGKMMLILVQTESVSALLLREGNTV